MKMGWFLYPLRRRSRSLRSYLAADDSAAKLRTCHDGVFSRDGEYEVIAFFERGHERKQRVHLTKPSQSGMTYAQPRENRAWPGPGWHAWQGQGWDGPTEVHANLG